MIQINLSEKQARDLALKLMAFSTYKDPITSEVLTQLENQLIPRAIEQANLAAWRGEKRVKEG